MKQQLQTRRNLLKTVGIGAIAAPFASGLGATENASEEAGLQVKVAGYDYDRVKGIMDGRSGIKGANVSFHYEDIYSVNETMTSGTTLSFLSSYPGCFVTEISSFDRIRALKSPKTSKASGWAHPAMA